MSFIFISSALLGMVSAGVVNGQLPPGVNQNHLFVRYISM